MIRKSIYLSNDNQLDEILDYTELSIDELELIVGRFNKNSRFAGKLRGELIISIDNKISIRHHFTKKILWELSV